MISMTIARSWFFEYRIAELSDHFAEGALGRQHFQVNRSRPRMRDGKVLVLQY